MKSEQDLEHLFRTYYTELCDYVLTIVESKAEAEDIVQDVFAQLWERRGSWKPHTSQKAYLFQAVRNNTLSELDRHRVTLHSDQDVRTLSGVCVLPDQALQRTELVADLRSAVERMPERQREVFRLSRIGGLTYREIAAVLEISSSTVETHMVRALRFLREAIRVHL